MDITNQIRNDIGVSLEVIAVLPLVLVAIISGWLADTKVGRSKVVQAGLSLTWLGVVLATVGNVLNLSLHTTSTPLNGVIQAVQYVAFCATYGGAAVFCTNVVQFGLEQMPDASSDAMTAYISWIALVTFLGEGSFNLAVTLLQHFISFHNIIVVRAIVACSLLSIAMCSKFLFSHWLIDHRQNHHPLKTVYRVLKFAKQHKYPVNRSAFTYCEDEIPSRIDFGKRKYGGPFTTEEVEDVKTFFKILLILTAVFAFVMIILPLLTAVPVFSYRKVYITRLIFSMEGFFTAAVFLMYDYIVYPCVKIRYKLSVFKWISFCMLYGILMAVILCVCCTHRNCFS